MFFSLPTKIAQISEKLHSFASVFPIVWQISHPAPKNSRGQKAFSLSALGVYFSDKLVILVAAAAKEAQQIQEQVHKIEIQAQCTECCQLLSRSAIGGLHRRIFNFLCIPSGETDEDSHTGKADYPFHAAALEEDVHHRADNQADERHEHYRAKLG